MRVFVNQSFRKFAKQNLITNDSLCKAVREISVGLVDANLGGGVYKQRIARRGQGKSGGYRTILFFKSHQLAFFIVGFAKNRKDNLEPDEVAALKDLAGRMLHYADKTIDLTLKNGTLEEITCKEAIS